MADKTLSITATINLDLACLKERNNSMAIRQGLPPIGATLANAHGIIWVVDGHTFAPSVMTLGRTEKECDPRDLYPVSIPQNLSKKLQDMLQELHACTPKDFVPLDTVPHLRPYQAMPYSHSVDSVSDPNRILLFFDSARIHEAAFAHELAHVWLELVEGVEDYRVLEDLTDSVRYGQVQRIQSFVLDFRVNDLIRSRGFDTLELENDRVKSLEQLSIAVSKGYQPPTRWESVAMAMLLTEVFVESTKVLTRSDEIFAILREKLPEEWELAEGLAEIVRSEPRSSGDSVRRCVDKALILCFTFAGEHLNLEKDLIERPPNVNWRDKWPGWLSELTPQQKCEVGKAMARSGLGGYAKVQLLNSMAGAGVQFSTDGGIWTEPVALPFRLPDPTQPHAAGLRIVEINEQNRRRQMEQFERMKNGNPGRRTYSTGEARFITQVRMEEMLAGEHPYSYALNNPVTYVDPTGLSPQSGLRDSCQVQLDDCLERATKAWDLCTRRAQARYNYDMKGCSPLTGPAKQTCQAAATAKLLAALTGCGAKENWRFGLCEGQYAACKEGQNAAHAVVCLTVAAGATYCIYRVCKVIIGVTGAAESGGGTLVWALAP